MASSEQATNNTKGSAFYSALLILQCIIWGVGNPITKFGMETVSPFTFLAFRFTLAFLLFMLFFGKGIVKDLKKEYIISASIVGLFTAASFIFSTFALLLTAATITGFLMALSVVFTPILSFFVLRHRADKKLIFVILIVVIGMYFLCANGGKFTFGIGELFGILTAVSGAAMLIYSSKHVSNIGPITLSTIQTLVCAVTCILCMFLFEDIGDLAYVSGEGWFSILYMAVGCTCIAYMLQNIALRKVSATFVSLAFCSEPIFTAIASYFLLGETLSIKGLFGCLLIVIGLILSTLSTDQKKDPEKKEGNLSNDEDKEKTCD